MRIKRKFLKRIILEAMTGSTQGGLAVKGMMPTSQHPDAVMVALEDTKKLIRILGVTSGYKTKPQYIWKDSKVGASEKLYAVGELTNGNGDPFTYNKEGNKYRVISGPEPKTIGKVFSLSPPPSVEVEDTEDSESLQTKFAESLLEISMEDYANLYLTPEQLNVFNSWPIFSMHKNLSVQEWFSRDKEIIRKAVENGQAAAQRIRSGEAQPGALRAPVNLIDAYAAGPDDQQAMERVYQTARETIITDELKKEFEN